MMLFQYYHRDKTSTRPKTEDIYLFLFQWCKTTAALSGFKKYKIGSISCIFCIWPNSFHATIYGFSFLIMFMQQHVSDIIAIHVNVCIKSINYEMCYVKHFRIVLCVLLFVFWSLFFFFSHRVVTLLLNWQFEYYFLGLFRLSSIGRFESMG